MVSLRQLIVLFILFLTRFVNGSISIDKNGYSGLLVAISEEIPQPQDGGLELIGHLKVCQ